MKHSRGFVATLTAIVTGLMLCPASAEVGVGGNPRCPTGTAEFHKLLTHDDLKEIFRNKNAPACRTGTTAAYFICPAQGRFDIHCLKAEDVEKARKGEKR